MSRFHCRCGFAIDDPAEFGDHLREAFPPPDATGQDGRKHGLTNTATPDQWRLT